MQIRMITCAAGPDFSAQPGDFKSVDAEFGKTLIEAGHAELATDAQARDERLGEAQAEARETTTSPAAKRRGKR